MLSSARTIHTYAALAGGLGAGLAQLPGSDAPALVVLQTRMILSLADDVGASLSRAAAVDLALTLGATMAGRTASQWLLGWVPGWGNTVNAVTAAALTEAVGWGAVRWLEER